MKFSGAWVTAGCLIVAASAAWGQGAGAPAGRPTSRPAAAPTSQQAQTAEAKFEEAVKANPDLPAGWQALASLAYEKKGDGAKAKDDFAKARELGLK